MERVITKDIGRNFFKGETKDYPHNVWENIAESLGEPLDSFSKLTSEVIQNVSPKAGNLRNGSSTSKRHR